MPKPCTAPRGSAMLTCGGRERGTEARASREQREREGTEARASREQREREGGHRVQRWAHLREYDGALEVQPPFHRGLRERERVAAREAEQERAGFLQSKRCAFCVCLLKYAAWKRVFTIIVQLI